MWKDNKHIKLFLIEWGIFLLGILIIGTVLTISKIRIDNQMAKAEIEKMKEPVNVNWNQYYHSPMNEGTQ